MENKFKTKKTTNQNADEASDFNEDARLPNMSGAQRKKYRNYISQGFSMEEALEKSKVQRSSGKAMQNMQATEAKPERPPHPDCTMSKEELKKMSYMLPSAKLRSRFIYDTYILGANPDQVMKRMLSDPEIQDVLDDMALTGCLPHIPAKFRVPNRQKPERGVLSKQDSSRGKGLRGGPSRRDPPVPPGRDPSGPSGPFPRDDQSFTQQCQRLISNMNNFGATGLGVIPLAVPGMGMDEMERNEEPQRRVLEEPVHDQPGPHRFDGRQPRPGQECQDRRNSTQSGPSIGSIADLPGIDGPLKQEYERLLTNVNKIGGFGNINMDLPLHNPSDSSRTPPMSGPGPSAQKRKRFNDQHTEPKRGRFTGEPSTGSGPHRHAGVEWGPGPNHDYPHPRGPVTPRRPTRLEEPQVNRPDPHIPARTQPRPGLNREVHGNMLSFSNEQHRNTPQFNNGGQGNMPPFNDGPQGNMPPFNNEFRGDMPSFNNEFHGGMPPFNIGPQGNVPPFNNGPQGNMPAFNNGPQGNMPQFNNGPQGNMPQFNNGPQGNMPPFNNNGPQGNMPPFNSGPQNTMQPFNSNRPQGNMQPFNSEPHGNTQPFINGPQGNEHPFSNEFHGDILPFSNADHGNVHPGLSQRHQPSHVAPFSGDVHGNKHPGLPRGNPYHPSLSGGQPSMEQLQNRPSSTSNLGSSSRRMSPAAAPDPKPPKRSATMDEISRTDGDPKAPMFIVPFRYPSERFSEEQMDAIENAILDAILEIDDERLKPTFQDSFRSNGRYGVICNDQLSKNWLFSYLYRCRPWPYASLKIISAESTKIKADALLPLCKNDDNHKILKFIGKQNTKLNVGQWEVVQRLDGVCNTSLSLAIDEDSANALKNNSTINFKMGRAEVIVMDDQSGGPGARRVEGLQQELMTNSQKKNEPSFGMTGRGRPDHRGTGAHPEPRPVVTGRGSERSGNFEQQGQGSFRPSQETVRLPAPPPVTKDAVRMLRTNSEYSEYEPSRSDRFFRTPSPEPRVMPPSDSRECSRQGDPDAHRHRAQPYWIPTSGGLIERDHSTVDNSIPVLNSNRNANMGGNARRGGPSQRNSTLGGSSSGVVQSNRIPIIDGNPRRERPPRDNPNSNNQRSGQLPPSRSNHPNFPSRR